MKNERKYQIAIIILCFLIIIFLIKGCNKNLKIAKLEKQINTKDSIINIKQELISEKNYQLKLSETKENEANKRAEEIKSTIETIKNNTTITITTPENK
jgi:predicted Holliday junction resolvase-like endonuclease